MFENIAWPLTTKTFYLLLHESQLPNKSYPCYNPKTKIFRVFENTEKIADIESEGFHMLSLRDIVCYGEQLRTEYEIDPTNTHEVSVILEKMSQEQSALDRQTGAIMGLVKQIFESFLNYFRGLGFQSTSSAASLFATQLVKIPPRTSATSEVVPKLSELEPNKEVTSLILSPPIAEFAEFPRQEASKIIIPGQKHPRFKSYQKYVAERVSGNLDASIGQMVVTQVIQAAKFPKENSTDTTQCYFGLMRAVSNVELFDPTQKKAYADFSNPLASQVILDLIFHGTSDFILAFFEKLKVYTTFNSKGLAACLKGYLARQEPKNITFLLDVLKHYRYNVNHKEFPLSDPLIVEAMGLLLAKAYLEKDASLLLEWYTKDSSYNYEVAVSLTEAFKNAKRSFAGACPNLDLVIALFKDSNLQRLQEEQKELYDLLFTPSKQEIQSSPSSKSVSTIRGQKLARQESARFKRQGSQILTPKVSSLPLIVPPNKKKWVEAYVQFVDKKASGQECEFPASGSRIFQDLTIKPEEMNPKDSTHSLKGLILSISGAKKIDIQDQNNPVEYVDFTDPKTLQIFVDALCHAKSEQISPLWEWVDANPTFKIEAIRQCFLALGERVEKKNSSFFQECFKKYRHAYREFGKTLPLHDPIVYKALSNLISFVPFEIQESAKWYINYFTSHLHHFSKDHLEAVPGLLRLIEEHPELATKLHFKDEQSVYGAIERELQYKETYKRDSDWYLKYDEEGNRLCSEGEFKTIFSYVNSPLSHILPEEIQQKKEELEELKRSVITNWKQWMKQFSHEPCSYILDNFTRNPNANATLYDLIDLGIDKRQLSE